MQKNVLEIEAVIKYYGVRELLHDCYLKCMTGDIIGILGRNGCGKSTLLKIIFGIESALNKTIRINGKPIKQPYRSGLVSYMPQFTFMPANEKLSRIISLYIQDKQAKEMVMEKFRTLGFLDKKPEELSGGQLKLFELTVLINLQSKFILLDEPFANIEPLYKEQVIAEIKSFSPTKGFIITDHDYESVIKASDSIMLLADGSLKPVSEVNDLKFLNYLPDNVSPDLDQYWHGK